MIRIYGMPRSSAGRCFLVLEEIGVPYKQEPIDMMGKKEHKSEAFLKLNPNGKIPCLVDGDYTIWESVAINHYLAAKYKPDLLGSTPEEKGHIEQWSLWGLVELQPPMVDILIQIMFVPEDKKDPSIITKAKEKIQPLLGVLDRHLEAKTFVVGNKISLADFNLFSVVNIATSIDISLDPYPNLSHWLNRLHERPTIRKIMEMRRS